MQSYEKESIQFRPHWSSVNKFCAFFVKKRGLFEQAKLASFRALEKGAKF